MGHHHEPQSYNRSFAIAAVLNSVFVVIEAVYAVQANSASLLADAGHNLGDVLGLIFAWFANWLLTQDSGDDFSYGHKRATILAALVNALLILLTATLIAYEGFAKLMAPEPVAEMTVIIVALIGIMLNGGTALMFYQGRKQDLNIEGAFLHLAYDALISVAVVVAGVVIYFTNLEIIDPILSLIIVVVIVIGTWRLTKDSTRMILDAVPRHIEMDKVKEYLITIPGVTQVHDVHIWGISTREIALTAHLVIPDREFDDEDHRRVNEDLWQQFKINHITIQVEKGLIKDPCGQNKPC